MKLKEEEKIKENKGNKGENPNKNKSFINKVIEKLSLFWYKFKKIVFVFIIIFFLVVNRLYIEKKSLVIYLNSSRNHYSNYTILKEKKSLLKYLSKRLKKNIESLFLDSFNNFGNQVLMLNKAIFYCEILDCKNIILNEDYYWFMKNKINYTYKNNLTMTIETVDKKVYQNNTNVLFDNTNNYFVFYGCVRPQYRIDVIKNEILINLPKIIVNTEDLFIYIRSGDIFEKTIRNYIQPPLCFYKAILDNFIFGNIYIISENKNNKLIDELLVQYPNITYNRNSLKNDVSILAHAYNVVGGYTTFLKTIILLNDNLKKFWYFDFYVSRPYSYFFSYEFNHKNITIYKMKNKNYNYYHKIVKFHSLPSQFNFMMNYDCRCNFTVINYI